MELEPFTNMTKSLGAFLAIAAILLTVDGARAIPIAVENISGDSNSLHAEFSSAWAATGERGGSTEGIWEGGRWEFIYFASGGPKTSFDPAITEGILSYTIRTFWNDGWIPGGLGNFSVVLYGLSNGNGGSILATSDHVWQDFSGLDLRYFLDASVGTALATSIDTSGNARFAFDVTRTAVPESSSTLILLSASLIALGVAARRA